MKNYNFDPQPYKDEIKLILQKVKELEDFNDDSYRKVLQQHPKDGKALFSKDHLVAGYKLLLKNNEIKQDNEIETRIKMKPTRTISGVVPITVLTKPFHCPGECIFCPLERGMPKSYLADEPGAQRAARNKFDPYMQTYNRLKALKEIGHNTVKAELIILGGTWSYYPLYYQIWFIKEMFRALNDFGVKEADKWGEPKDKKDNETLWKQLFEEQVKNETAITRSVGLSIETRPDFVDEKEVIKLRTMGCTKIQIGVQSMDDKVLDMNKRGHDRRASIDAANTLRRAGFKIQIHYMPNLYGSTPEIDIAGYKDLYGPETINPDEIKLYPTSIIANTELLDRFNEGKYKPYDEKTLVNTLCECLKTTQPFTRLSRVIRDIPSTDIITGNKKTNLREIVERKLKEDGVEHQDIRHREIRKEKFDPEEIILDEVKYETEVSDEYFLQFITPKNTIIAFLRLSLPKDRDNHFIGELRNSSLIREIHVYGISLNIKQTKKKSPQHLGLGTKLIQRAKEISEEYKFEKMGVISAIGTKEYYRKKGFEDGELYQFMPLED